MRPTMNERRAVTAVMVARYRRASRRQKGRLLDELIALTGDYRCYAVGPTPPRGGPLRSGAGKTTARPPYKTPVLVRGVRRAF